MINKKCYNNRIVRGMPAYLTVALLSFSKLFSYTNGNSAWTYFIVSCKRQLMGLRYFFYRAKNIKCISTSNAKKRYQYFYTHNTIFYFCGDIAVNRNSCKYFFNDQQIFHDYKVSGKNNFQVKLFVLLKNFPKKFFLKPHIKN